MDRYFIKQYKENLISTYSYKQLPKFIEQEALKVIRESVPEYLNLNGGSETLYSPKDVKVCKGYARILITPYGAYVEMSATQIVSANFITEEYEMYKVKNPQKYHNFKKIDMYICGNKEVRVHEQFNTVTWGDFKAGYYYIATEDVKIKECK